MTAVFGGASRRCADVAAARHRVCATPRRRLRPGTPASSNACVRIVATLGVRRVPVPRLVRRIRDVLSEAAGGCSTTVPELLVSAAAQTEPLAASDEDSQLSTRTVREPTKASDAPTAGRIKTRRRRDMKLGFSATMLAPLESKQRNARHIGRSRRNHGPRVVCGQTIAESRRPANSPVMCTFMCTVISTFQVG